MWFVLQTQGKKLVTYISLYKKSFASLSGIPFRTYLVCLLKFPEVLSFLFSKQAENWNLPLKPLSAVACCCHRVLLLKLDPVQPLDVCSAVKLLTGPEVCTDFTGGTWGLLKAFRVHIIRSSAIVSHFTAIVPGL